MDKEVLRNTVDKLVEWERLAKEAKREMDQLKLHLQNMALSEMENSKVKQVKYYGSGGGRVVITQADKVDLVSHAYLAKVIPDQVLGDFVKTETVHKMTQAFKDIVGPVAEGRYVECSVAEVIRQMPLPEEAVKAAGKKLKGKFDKDVRLLEEWGVADPEHWAYFVAEAAAWERLTNLMEIAGHAPETPGFHQAVQRLRHAVIVDSTVKIGVEYDEG